jgi:chromosomal replication initiator protein
VAEGPASILVTIYQHAQHSADAAPKLQVMQLSADAAVTGLDPSLTFAEFVSGSANVLAVNAAQRMAALETPQFSPLYLKGATGQGKTHLLHAIGHAYAAARPGARIFYCSAERFMIEFVQAMRSNEMLEFKARLRGFDLLLVDDIQFIIGKASTQEEFLHTIDALMSAGKRLVVAADRAPQALDGVEQRLLSRLSMGLVADIQPADIDLRRKILEHILNEDEAEAKKVAGGEWENLKAHAALKRCAALRKTSKGGQWHPGSAAEGHAC